MRILLYIISFSALSTALMSASSAYAFHELGIDLSALNMVEDVLNKKEKNEVEHLDNVDQEIDKAERGGKDGEPEGKLLSDKLKKAKKYAKTAITVAQVAQNFSAEEFMQNVMNEVKQDLSKMSKSELDKMLHQLRKCELDAKKEIEKINEELKVLDEAEKEERVDKIKAIETEKMAKELALSKFEQGSDEALKLALEIRDLEAQKEQLIEKTQQDESAQENGENGEKIGQKDAIAQKYFDMKIAALDKKIEAENKYKKCENTHKDAEKAKGFAEEAAEEFDAQTEAESDEETASLYGEIIEDFFLKEDEESNSRTVGRIRQNRKRAYYQALQNLFVTAMQSDGASLEAGEDAQASLEAITETSETNMGAEMMQIRVDIQSVKSATWLTRLLLAKIQMETMEEIQSWTTNDKMQDYSQDVTRFNLDNYKLEGWVGRLNDKINNFLKKGRKDIAEKGKNWTGNIRNKLNQNKK